MASFCDAVKGAGARGLCALQVAELVSWSPQTPAPGVPNMSESCANAVPDTGVPYCVSTAPEKLAAALSSIPGVVDHGLFIGMASLAFIAGAHGVETLKK